MELFGTSYIITTPRLQPNHYFASLPYNLLKDARAGDLVIGGKVIGAKELMALVRDGGLLEDCQLLQKLLSLAGSIGSLTAKKDEEVTPKLKPPVKNSNSANELLLKQLKDFLFSAIKTQHLIGIQLLIKNATSQFPEVEKSHIEQVIKQLCLEKQAQIINPNQPLKDRLICLVVQKK